MGKFAKHLAKSQKITINEDEIEIKPLGVEYLPDIFLAMKCFSSGSTDPAKVLENVNREGLQALTRLITATLKVSYPNEPENELSQFGLKYMGTLLTAIFEINTESVETLPPELKRRLEAARKVEDERNRKDKEKPIQ